MEAEEEPVSILSRKELRKQKFMEYLAEKGKLKPSNPKPYLRDNCLVKKHVITSVKVVQGKENQAPADRFTYGGAKIQSLPAQSTKHAAARKTFGDSNKVNVKANVLTGRQDASRTSAAGGAARPRLNQIPVLTRKSTVLSSSCNPTAARHLKKQPTPGITSSGRSHSNASVTKSNGRFSSKATRLCPLTTVSVRMSLGPMVKTKTGLIPAVIQPRNGQSQHLKHTSATAADPITSVSAAGAKKMPSSSLPPVSVSRTSATTQRKPLPTTSQRERARAGITVPNASKSNFKPILSRNPQPSLKIPSSSELKSTAAPSKPQGRAAGPPTDRFTKQRSEGAGQKNTQPCKAAPQTTTTTSSSSSSAASRCGSRALSGITPAAAAEPGGKSNAREEANGKKGRSSANAPPSQMGTSHTVPRPGRTISHTGRPADAKTPKGPVRVVPQTEGKKVTAAQEERMRKLQDWREAKGISYKRPPMPVKPQVRRTVAVPQPFWGAMNEEDDAHSLIAAVDRSLADCIELLAKGCPPGQVREVLSRLPAVSRKFAKYWICRARLLEREGHLDVLPMFQEAVAVVLEPVDELRAVVFEILKKKDDTQENEEEGEEDQRPASERTPESISKDPMATPKPVRTIVRGEKGDSSVVKYKITATPGGAPRHQTATPQVNGQEVRFITPVRRSVRIERSSRRYPAALQDHDRCVASSRDLIHEEDGHSAGARSPAAPDAPLYVYRQNDALEDKVLVRLVYDDAV
ncbi:cytoskeleton-associated protein 2-like [Clinocottus analis]|uniref:cytoskeleton-associated protein 2-like n=1 Tax=Clinocottus analis TaxID=304258 RepID=UPI0035C10620